MSDQQQHIDSILADWPYLFGEVIARQVVGGDGREVLQLRVDMGVLQLEASGRPDGSRPGGHATYYDHLVALAAIALKEEEPFALNEEQCIEVDREFVQFFHRRICWLSLRQFDRAIEDADHTLALMDFSLAHSPDESWSEMHEQYRPFVLFHRTQAAALAELEKDQAEEALVAIDAGLDRLHTLFVDFEVEDEFDQDELVLKLREMKEAVSDHYDLEPSLAKRLADAIAEEQYELAAELRDKMGGEPRL